MFLFYRFGGCTNLYGDASIIEDGVSAFRRMFGFNDEVLVDLIQWVVPLGDISFAVVKVVGLQFVIIAESIKNNECYRSLDNSKMASENIQLFKINI